MQARRQQPGHTCHGMQRNLALKDGRFTDTGLEPAFGGHRDDVLVGLGALALQPCGAAIKGLQPIAGDYARSRSLSKEGLNEMIAIKKKVSPKMLKDFIADGPIEAPAKGK